MAFNGSGSDGPHNKRLCTGNSSSDTDSVHNRVSFFYF